MKKLLSILLIIAVMFTLSVPAFAVEPVQVNQQTEIPDGFVLFDSETSFIDDGSGNLVEVTVNEYRRPVNSNIALLADVGEERIYTFDISNDALGFPSLAVGVPLTSAMKNKIASIVTQKLGEKVAGALLPGVNVASWVLAAIAATNSLAGNNGFRITISVIYTETFEHKEGIYTWGWDITDCGFSVY